MKKIELYEAHGNTFKPNNSHVVAYDPFRNMMMFFLTNLREDLERMPVEEVLIQSDEYEQPYHYNPFRRMVKISEKVIDGTKKFGGGFKDAHKNITHPKISPRQLENGHVLPHPSNNCKCLDRLLRQDITQLNEYMRGLEMVHDQYEKLGLTGHRSKKNSIPWNNNFHSIATINVSPTVLKMEDHNVPSVNVQEISTVPTEAPRNDQLIRVFRLSDYNLTSGEPETLHETNHTDKKERNNVDVLQEKILVDLQLPMKKHTSVDEATFTELPTRSKRTKRIDNFDGNYYFLSFNGGVDDVTGIKSSNNQSDTKTEELVISKSDSIDNYTARTKCDDKISTRFEKDLIYTQSSYNDTKTESEKSIVIKKEINETNGEVLLLQKHENAEEVTSAAKGNTTLENNYILNKKLDEIDYQKGPQQTNNDADNRTTAKTQTSTQSGTTKETVRKIFRFKDGYVEIKSNLVELKPVQTPDTIGGGRNFEMLHEMRSKSTNDDYDHVLQNGDFPKKYGDNKNYMKSGVGGNGWKKGSGEMDRNLLLYVTLPTFLCKYAILHVSFFVSVFVKVFAHTSC